MKRRDEVYVGSEVLEMEQNSEKERGKSKTETGDIYKH